MFRKLFDRIKKVIPQKEVKIISNSNTSFNAIENKLMYPNRFLKFYYQNKERLNNSRRDSYSHRKKNGICVRCSTKAEPGIIFCARHQDRQKEYNQKARAKV